MNFCYITVQDTLEDGGIPENMVGPHLTVTGGLVTIVPLPDCSQYYAGKSLPSGGHTTPDISNVCKTTGWVVAVLGLSAKENLVRLVANNERR